MKKLFLILVLIFTVYQLVFAQLSLQKPVDYYSLAIEESNKGNLPEAIKLFKLSISEYDNPDSYFELAKIYYKKNTVESRVKARELIQKAIWKDPNNVEYRLLQAELMECFSRNLAYKYYEEILDIDKNCTTALFNLGRIKEEEFYEYNNSVLQVESDPALSFNVFAIEEFIKAERFLKSAIKSDSACIDAYIHLAKLYEEIDEPAKGIHYLKKVNDYDPENKETALLLGIFYYKTSRLDSAYFAYERAINMMDQNEKKEFKYLSASFLTENKIIENSDHNYKPEEDKVVDNFWKISDPLFLTKYNERLLEHYSRVSYSNLKFSVDELELKGWNTDRGETVIRYGEPLKKIRYRPYINAGGRTQLMLKTDFWYYKDKVLGFVDEYWNENFQFSTPRPGSRHLSQFPGDADFFMNDLRRTEPESYEPRFEGPAINVPFQIVQFKDIENDSVSTTQVYFNYALYSEKNMNYKNRNSLAHRYGIFFIKGDSEVESKKISRISDLDYRRELKLGLNEIYKVNSVLVNALPDSGILALEIIRDSDKGTFSKRTNFAIKKFNQTELDISDIILASVVDKEHSRAIKRNNLNLLPNPINTFTAINDIYIYYEVYNLVPNESGSAEFMQRITISQINEHSGMENFLNSLLGVIGLGDKEEVLTLETKYQSFEKNSPVYLQLDMSKYEKGDYNINIEIEDLSTGDVASSQTILRWK